MFKLLCRIIRDYVKYTVYCFTCFLVFYGTIGLIVERRNKKRGSK